MATIEHIAMYVLDLERATGDGYDESCVIAFENNLIELTMQGS